MFNLFKSKVDTNIYASIQGKCVDITEVRRCVDIMENVLRKKKYN